METRPSSFGSAAMHGKQPRLGERDAQHTSAKPDARRRGAAQGEERVLDRSPVLGTVVAVLRSAEGCRREPRSRSALFAAPRASGRRGTRVPAPAASGRGRLGGGSRSRTSRCRHPADGSPRIACARRIAGSGLHRCNEFRDEIVGRRIAARSARRRSASTTRCQPSLDRRHGALAHVATAVEGHHQSRPGAPAAGSSAHPNVSRAFRSRRCPASACLARRFLERLNNL